MRTFKPLGVNFLANICFKSVRKNFKVQLMQLTLIYCQKVAFFHKKRARTFAQIPSKQKNACNIHNSEFACKKSASYENSKLYLNTVQIFWRVIPLMPPPLYIITVLKCTTGP